MSSLTRTITRARIRRQMEEYGIAHPCRFGYFARNWREWPKMDKNQRRNRK